MPQESVIGMSQYSALTEQDAETSEVDTLLLSESLDITTDSIWTVTPSFSILDPSSEQHATSALSDSATQRDVTDDDEVSGLLDIRYGSIALLSPWFPAVDPKHKRARTWRTWSSQQHILLTTASIVSTLVFLINLSLTLYVQIKHKTVSDTVSLYENDCSSVQKLDTGLHVLINLLSTLLLGASNLCMQILAAPSRQDVDKAHASQKWLDIGVPSWKNLKSIDPKRQAAWWCLVLSSVPIHFIYNATISSSVPCYGFAFGFVTESFVQGNAWGNNITLAPTSNDPYPYLYDWPPQEIWNQTATLIYMQQNAFDTNVISNITAWDCLQLYNQMYGPRTNVLMVLHDNNTSEGPSLLDYNYGPASYYHDEAWWACGSLSAGDCHFPKRLTQEQLDNWTIMNRRPLYCLHEKFPGKRCKLIASTPLMIAVSCLNAFKCVCVILTTYYFSTSKVAPLCTLGDAVSSFLETPDPYTAHLGIVSTLSVKDPRFWLRDHVNHVVWRPKKLRWYSAASFRRWIITISLIIVATVVAVVTMASGAHGTMTRTFLNYSSILKLPYGVPNPTAFTAYFLPKFGARGFIANVIWANYWQMIVSTLYLAYNGLLTCQLVSEEWSGYATDRKTLRVSHPKGIQRSSYYLSLPLRYGVPLMACLATIHLLVSQSMFVVNTATYYPNYVEDTSSSFTTTGYSTAAALSSIIFGLVASLILILNSFRTLPNGMPLASTCSATISAACHPPPEDSDAHLLPVKWGCLPDNTTDGEQEGLRCTFTTHRGVQPPIKGNKYLGLDPHEVPVREGRLKSWRGQVKLRANGLLRTCWRYCKSKSV